MWHLIWVVISLIYLSLIYLLIRYKESPFFLWLTRSKTKTVYITLTLSELRLPKHVCSSLSTVSERGMTFKKGHDLCSVKHRTGCCRCLRIPHTLTEVTNTSGWSADMQSVCFWRIYLLYSTWRTVSLSLHQNADSRWVALEKYEQLPN